MSKKQADALRALRENTFAFIKKHGGIEAATNALPFSPGRQQASVDIRERALQGVEFEEDAMEFLDDTSIDSEFIAMEEAINAPALRLPRIGGKLGRILKLADEGKSPQAIADDRYVRLTRRQINYILADKKGTLRGKIEAARQQLELPL
jgi:hypothetical protein